MKLDFGISIVICCYNSEKRIIPTLEHLQRLNHVENCPFEIIIVDNNSSDHTVSTVIDFAKNHPKLEIKLITELKQGLSFARLKGVDNSTYKYILFCDDDNWLDSNYLLEACSLLNQFPNTGIIGGTGSAISDAQLPFWFEAHSTGYACYGLPANVNIDITKTNFSPYGAGMLINKEILHTIDFITTGRKGKSLASGDDSEMVLYARLMGYTILWSNKMTFKHYIPEGRLTWDYCKRLFYSFGQSEAHLMCYEYLLSDKSLSFRYFFWKRVKNYSKDLLSSWKRLYFIFFKDLEGEEYFTIYLRKWNFVKTSIKEYRNIKNHYNLLQNKGK